MKQQIIHYSCQKFKPHAMVKLQEVWIRRILNENDEMK